MSDQCGLGQLHLHVIGLCHRPAPGLDGQHVPLDVA
jgi:hypothetical protein